MENYSVILGVDVSKLTLDISSAERRLHLKIPNDGKGFASFVKWCRLSGIDLETAFVVLEHTGGYEYRFLQFCESKNVCYCRVPGLEIKRSMGMTRGKSDQIDSFRISRYGEEKIKRLKPDSRLDVNIIQLKQLLSYRKRLVRENAGLLNTIKERKHVFQSPGSDIITRLSKQKMRMNERLTATIEGEIRRLIESNESFLKNYRILTSIKGIGPVNAWMTIAYTGNFTGFRDARKYAVYVGVIPFDNFSGTSIKGRKRVSHLANKELKQELTQAARVAIIHDKEIKAYAERKLVNKHFGVVVNNVRFKLLLRIFSLIKRGELYVGDYLKAS
ncbi:transposase [Parapedobacter tibetensis]|uniref:transposase n=1 Tax=Parapedobacter tibetensis TaxID=2972951 RepID=UPI00214D3BA5|nr:transposase [Parapedobacter tibetensis]